MVVTNEGTGTLWNLRIPVHDMWVDTHVLDDTHMPDAWKQDPVQLSRIEPGETVRIRQVLAGLDGIKRLSGTCVVRFSSDAPGPLPQRQTVPYTVELGAL